MSDIFVTGHRNPDTDSIVAAIAYANLRNVLGDREYIPARIGAINDETQAMLDRFGFEAPLYVNNMRTQICDLDFDRLPELGLSVTIDLAWRTMREEKIPSMPILNEDGTLYGLLSTGDIANYDMMTIETNHIDDVPVFNLVSVLEGKLVNEYSNLVTSVSGDVRIALPQTYEDDVQFFRDNILICGAQPDVVDRALKNHVNCLIICQSDIDPRWMNSSAETCIISTPLSARRTARLIYQAIPVSRVCQTGEIICFHLNDLVDDVKEIMLKSRFRSYPVLDEHERVVGTISRYHLLKPRRKRVVLVDHNEASQSVPGLEQVEIVEIIDHHRLADIQTTQPVAVRNEPVGCTNTIITTMYQEHGVVPSPKLAGLMASAILSDTVMFKSPTCTKKDIAMAERLSRIAHVSLEDIGKDLFSSSSPDNKTAEELFLTDYKVLHISEKNIGVSQITTADSEHLLSRRDEFLQYMNRLKSKESFDIVILMITDVLTEGSHLLYIGNDDIIRQAFAVEPQNQHVFLKKVMSRKKQIIPMLTALWG